jgi:purine-binding chemotaxis protein CheW
LNPLKITANTQFMNQTITAPSTPLAGKYLTFTLGAESYGLPVLRVREIIQVASVTAVPQLPEYFQGVTNLRGKIVPVMDLHLRLGGPASLNTEQTCIIVAEIRLSGRSAILMGLRVDGVEEGLNIAAGDLEESLDFGCQISGEYIMGMAKIRGRVKILIDTDRLIEHSPCANNLQTNIDPR